MWTRAWWSAHAGAPTGLAVAGHRLAHPHTQHTPTPWHNPKSLLQQAHTRQSNTTIANTNTRTHTRETAQPQKFVATATYTRQYNTTIANTNTRTHTHTHARETTLTRRTNNYDNRGARSGGRGSATATATTPHNSSGSRGSSAPLKVCRDSCMRLAVALDSVRRTMARRMASAAEAAAGLRPTPTPSKGRQAKGYDNAHTHAGRAFNA